MLALFDLDNTLLEGDSDYAWGQFLVHHGLVDGPWYEHENKRYYEEYRAGTLNIATFLQFSLAPLARLDPNLLQTLRAEFVHDCVRPMIRPLAPKLIAHHRDLGHVPVIITATNSFVTRPIADLFGIDVLLATEPASSGGRFSGAVEGIPCFREGKVERLEMWMEKQGLDLTASWFYTDSHNDLPLLRRVTHPVAVDPDPRLLLEARRQAWSVISLRQPLAHPQTEDAAGCDQHCNREPE